MQFALHLSLRLKDVELQHEKSVSVEKLVVLLRCREEEDLPAIRHALEHFSDPTVFLGRELRAPIGEQLKGLAWLVYSSRTKDLQLHRAFDAVFDKFARQEDIQSWDLRRHPKLDHF